MKRYVYKLILAATALPALLAACMDDKEESEVSENCYISSFTLGTLRRSMYLKTTAGMDSIYTTTFTASYFPMSIDQRAGIIENHDSLPSGTRLDKVLTTAAFEGALFWRRADLTNQEDTTWNTYSAKDSMDLSQPLHFRIFSLTGLSERTYTVRVNVHTQRGDSTAWDSLGQTTLLEGIGERKAMVRDGKLTLWGLDAAGRLVCLQRERQGQGTWSANATTGADGASPKTMQQQGSNLYMSTRQGAILTSTDGITWTTTAYAPTAGLTLVAATTDHLYALADGKLYRSAEGAWEEEPLDEEGSNLPTEELNSVCYPTPDGGQRLMLVGSRNPADQTATVWSKRWNRGQEEAEPWFCYTPNRTDKYRCPMLEQLCIVPYDGGLQALGGRSRNGAYNALEHILHSSDNGVTWKTYDNNDMLVDTELQAQAQTARQITAAVDEEHFLWIVLDNNVWRGRINRLGFLRQDRY